MNYSDYRKIGHDICIIYKRENEPYGCRNDFHAFSFDEKEVIKQAKEWLAKHEDKSRLVFCLHYHQGYVRVPSCPDRRVGDSCIVNTYVARDITIGELEQSIR